MDRKDGFDRHGHGLKVCPVCGSDDVEICSVRGYTNGNWFDFVNGIYTPALQSVAHDAMCFTCRAKTGEFRTSGEAREAWNRGDIHGGDPEKRRNARGSETPRQNHEKQQGVM